MEMNQNNPKLAKEAAKKELWSRGNLRWKLTESQKEMYDLFYSSKFKVSTWLLARRSGKTFTLCILALEQCIKKENSVVKFVSPTKTQVNTNIRPLVRQILEDCPKELRPEFKEKEYIYFFPNGSEIQLAGSESGHAEKLRGGNSDLFFVDEAQTCSDLENVVKSVLLPTTLTTGGKGVLAGTPPEESDHQFLKFIEEAELRGTLIKKTIEDNKLITKEQMDELIAEVGGVNSEKARRELFCEIIKDSKTSVLPEFTPELEKEVVKDWPRPPFFDAYESMDIGGKDLTVVLFGYYDFRADKVIVEDEVVINFQNHEETILSLVKKINQKELQLWKNPISLEYKSPHYRVSDINYIMTTEILNHSKNLFVKEQYISFENARKDDNDAAINMLRIMLSNRKIIIHPRCETLLRHLRNVKWDSKKTKFARSADDGHYDAVDALKYLIRAIEFKRNPYPASYNYNMKDLFIRNFNNPNFQEPNSQVQIYKKIFNVKNKRKF